MNQKKILRTDYQAPVFQIPKTFLHFHVLSDYVTVTSQLHIKLNPEVVGMESISLNGEKLELLQIEIDNAPLETSRYQQTDSHLILYHPKPEFVLKTQVKLYPKSNTQLEGLYQSGQSLLTQCEPEGFRRITFYADRPDVMSAYTVEIEADQTQFPFLLSNGNLIKKTICDNRVKVTWADPFLKPCYLFALVAGDFDLLEDHYTTGSGRKIQLQCLVNKGNREKSQFALDSLKKAMKWDEERFGLEYDLDTYMIVATDDFNAGAMENKGLNIFNSRLVLADPKTATDDDYFAIESVVAHEYFHNWSGNRVTLRDWFNLSLKEGLTVFRDQEFSMDQHSKALVRIETVQRLRSKQFAEDAGPNAHPVYPEFCYAVDNFFTATIYEKGAEVIRMIQTLVGRPSFNRALKKYFEKFDGQAVTIEDFTDTIFDEALKDPNVTSPFDPIQFKLWYSQAGTPRVTVEVKFDLATQSYKLHFIQKTPRTPNQEVKQPLVIPLVTSVYTKEGSTLELDHPAFIKNSENQTLFILSAEVEKIEIPHPNPHLLFSFNQGFSSPVILQYELDLKSQIKLFQFEKDPFNKWDLAQTIYSDTFELCLKKENPISNSSPLPEEFLDALNQLIQDLSYDSHLLSLLLELPSESYIVQKMGELESQKLYQAKNAILKQMAKSLGISSKKRYFELKYQNMGSEFSTQDMATRKLKNQLLFILQGLPEGPSLAFQHFQNATNMSDKQSAFRLCLDSNDYRDQVKNQFFKEWHNDSLTLNKWFQSLAASLHATTNHTVKELWNHPKFNKQNPNRVYSLLRVWGNNLTQFHSDTANYDWMLERCLELDALNPQVAARVAQVFDFSTFLGNSHKAYLKQQIEKAIQKQMSPNLYEILSKVKGAL